MLFGHEQKRLFNRRVTTPRKLPRIWIAVPETAEVDSRGHSVRSYAHDLLAFRAFNECHGAPVARDRQNLTRVDRCRRVAPGDHHRRRGDDKQCQRRKDYGTKKNRLEMSSCHLRTPFPMTSFEATK